MRCLRLHGYQAGCNLAPSWHSMGQRTVDLNQAAARVWSKADSPVDLRPCSPEVLATPTADLGKILSAMHKASIGGESDLYTGIQIAQVGAYYSH